MGLNCQPTFFPIRPDIFKEEGLGPGLAAGDFGRNLCTIYAVLQILSGNQLRFQDSQEPKRVGERLLAVESMGGVGDKKEKPSQHHSSHFCRIYALLSISTPTILFKSHGNTRG